MGKGRKKMGYFKGMPVLEKETLRNFHTGVYPRDPVKERTADPCRPIDDVQRKLLLSLMPQGSDRVQPCSSPRRIEAEEDSDADGE
jgi:hypothetical protein